MVMLAVQVEDRMLMCEEVADSWREVEEQQADLKVQLREMDQHRQSLARRPAELEPKIAQNQLDKAQVCDQGGGVPFRKIDKLFSYMYSTAPSPQLDDHARTPLVRREHVDTARRSALSAV